MSEEAEQRQFEEERRKKEKQQLDELEAMAADWRRSEQIRAFVDAVERTLPTRDSEAAEDRHLAQWITWARNQARKIDPITKILQSK